MITLRSDSKEANKQLPEQKKLERIFPAIQILLPERPGSGDFPAPWGVRPDSREVFCMDSSVCAYWVGSYNIIDGYILGIHIKVLPISRQLTFNNRMITGNHNITEGGQKRLGLGFVPYEFNMGPETGHFLQCVIVHTPNIV